VHSAYTVSGGTLNPTHSWYWYC